MHAVTYHVVQLSKVMTFVRLSMNEIDIVITSRSQTSRQEGYANDLQRGKAEAECMYNCSSPSEISFSILMAGKS